jgi:hypothetical protein
MIPNVPAGGTTVDYTAANFNGMIGQAIYEVAGLGPAPVLDKSNSGGAGTGTAVSSGATGAITGAPELVLAGTMAFAGTPATNSGWTCLQPSGGADLTAGYQIATSSGGSFTWSQTSSGSPWAAGIVTVVASPVPSPLYPLRGARPRLIIPLLTGRARSSRGAPVSNPGVVPVQGSLPGAVRAALPVPARGRARFSRPGAAVTVQGAASLAAASSVTAAAAAGAAAAITAGSAVSTAARQLAGTTLAAASSVSDAAVQLAGTSLAAGSSVLTGGSAQGSASLSPAATLQAGSAQQGSAAALAAASAVSAPLAAQLAAVSLAAVSALSTAGRLQASASLAALSSVTAHGGVPPSLQNATSSPQVTGPAHGSRVTASVTSSPAVSDG